MNSHSLVEHDAIAAAVIGVASLPVALDLWVNVFGFELIAQQVGAAANLESFWRLPTGSIKAQAVATTAGVNTGRVWLVEFAAPAEAVRHGTATIDRCPKSLNLALRDLPARYKEMLARGLRFRSPYVKYPAGAFDVYEAQLLAHDEVNVGLLEMIGLPFAFNERGSAGFTNFVSVVEDLAAETAFYHEVLGLPLLSEHRLRGAAIEKLIGLPPGATVAMNIFGVEENPYGRMQLIAYEGASGVDRYASARPPARGLLHPVWLTERFEEAPEQAGTSWRESEPQTMDTPLGKVNALRLRTPAGMRLDVYQYL